MSWTSFKDAANYTLDRKGITSQIQDSLVIEVANQLMLDLLGTEVQDKIRVMHISRRTLIIAALDNQAASNLQNSKKRFLEKLNNKFEEDIVEDFNFLI